MSLSSPKNNTARINNNKIKSKQKKNMIQKDSNLSSYEFCKKLYQKNYCNPNILIISQIKQTNFKIILNSLSPTDILIVSEILKKYYYFKQIDISPYNSVKQNFPNITKYKTNKDNNQENKKKLEKYLEKMDKIFLGLSKHLPLTNNLLSLSLVNFELYSKYCLLLSKGLTNNKSLQILKISHCLIQLSSFESLIKSLYNHQSLSYLDLSYNNLNDKYGNIIIKLIMNQAQRRDQIIWSYGLRNEKPPINEKLGLISLNLSNNKLGNETADILTKVLSTDQYLRAIYLNDNKIENNSCKKFIYMMRKNLALLTIDLRGNPGYDDYLHSRLVMKMAKNMRYLYQQYKKGEFSEEEFENFKEFIDATFFDVDIPQEIVEFYNNNLPETSEENKEKSENDKDIKEENEININENKIKINNLIDDEEKKEILLINRQLSEENLMLKQQIKELKSKNDTKGKEENNKNKEKEIYKKTESDIDSYYTRVEELINELNDIMNKIEKKQSENKNKINDIQDNKININNYPNSKNRTNIDKNNNISKNVEKEQKKENNDNLLNKLLKNGKNNNENKQIYPKISPKLIEEKKGEEEAIKSIKSKEKEKKLESMPYKQLPAEPTEREKESSDENSHFEDEEGNIYNYDDLTDEEKMLIIQQKIILQKLQEEAEARGEQFNPQEYIEFLERQALEEEEEEDEDFKEGKGSNKLNKSF
jgi:hypothetical protein